MTRIGSLCSGYEGLGMAVQSVIGGELAWVADNDPGAAAILAHRFPSVPNLHDITTVNWAAAEPVDVLTAGFPCQDVSCAGARRGLREGTRTGVWAHVARAIAELRPSLVVLENVRGLLNAGADSDMELCPWCLGETGNEHALRACGAVFGDLADLGFDADGTLVSAADTGAPHRRERFFILAWPAADPAAASEGWGVVTGGGAWRPAAVGDEACAQPGDGYLTPAAHADSPVGSERRFAASGQAESGRPRADAGGRGGAPAADAERDGQSGRRPGGTGVPDEPREGSRAAATGCGPGASADTERGPGDGRSNEPVRGQDWGAATAGDSEILDGGGDSFPRRQRWIPMEPGTRQRTART